MTKNINSLLDRAESIFKTMLDNDLEKIEKDDELFSESTFDELAWDLNQIYKINKIRLQIKELGERDE